MALQKVKDAIATQFVTHTNHHQPLVLITFKLTVTPAGLFWQSNPMVWIHLPSSPKEVLLPYCDAVSEFVILGRENVRKHFGIEPAEVIQPHTRPQVDWLSQDTDTGPVAWASGRRFRQPSST